MKTEAKKIERDDIIRMAREAFLPYDYETGLPLYIPQLERFAALVVAAEREAWPNLEPVINWLENGCNHKDAAAELRLYDAAIRARGQA